MPLKQNIHRSKAIVRGRKHWVAREKADRTWRPPVFAKFRKATLYGGTEAAHDKESYCRHSLIVLCPPMGGHKNNQILRGSPPLTSKSWGFFRFCCFFFFLRARSLPAAAGPTQFLAYLESPEVLLSGTAQSLAGIPSKTWCFHFSASVSHL